MLLFGCSAFYCVWGLGRPCPRCVWDKFHVSTFWSFFRFCCFRVEDQLHGLPHLGNIRFAAVYVYGTRFLWGTVPVNLDGGILEFHG